MKFLVSYDNFDEFNLTGQFLLLRRRETQRGENNGEQKDFVRKVLWIYNNYIVTVALRPVTRVQEVVHGKRCTLNQTRNLVCFYIFIEKSYYLACQMLGRKNCISAVVHITSSLKLIYNIHLDMLWGGTRFCWDNTMDGGHFFSHNTEIFHICYCRFPLKSVNSQFGHHSAAHAVGVATSGTRIRSGRVPIVQIKEVSLAPFFFIKNVLFINSK